jgi:hypothetical protein
MKWILFTALAAWFVFGSLKKTVANWLWENDAAPWESVDAFYYPNRSDLSKDLRRSGLKNVRECRDWVDSISRQFNDPGITHGDYECGVGYLDDYGPLRVYRTTVR